MRVKLQFSNSITPKRIVIITAITMTLLLAAYYLHPSNNNWLNSDDFEIINFLQFVFLDQFFIECLTTSCILFLIIYYSKLLKIGFVESVPDQIILYYLKFIPLFLVVYFLFSPITITIRYLYHTILLDRQNLDFWNSYFFLNTSLYMAYLPVVFLSGIQFLTFVLIDSIKEAQKEKKEPILKNIMVNVKTETGEKLISSQSIVKILKEADSYKIYTASDVFHTLKNLSGFEKELGINFVRINRSTIINLAFFKEYSFWENEKYILRMTNNDEFNITRERLKFLKGRLVEYSQKVIFKS